MDVSVDASTNHAQDESDRLYGGVQKMAAILDIRNPIDVHKAGMRALNRELGNEGAQAFMKQHFEGVGDWMQERHEQPQESFDDFRADLGRVDAQVRARRGLS